MNCKSCGERLEEGQVYCPKCGEANLSALAHKEWVEEPATPYVVFDVGWSQYSEFFYTVSMSRDQAYFNYVGVTITYIVMAFFLAVFGHPYMALFIAVLLPPVQIVSWRRGRKRALELYPDQPM
jgi:predicted RNA-binding Zn-ribbon protein involved in translation (DUF1610 family)